MINLSYGIRMWAEFAFVLSQFMRLTDGQADRWRDTLLMANIALHRSSTVKIIEMESSFDIVTVNINCSYLCTTAIE